MKNGSPDIHRETGNTAVNPSYPIKVWMTALFLIAPIILWVEDRIVYHNIKISPQDLLTLLFLGLAGAVFSLPVYGILFVMFRFLTGKQLSPLQVKWTLNAICVIGVFITFKLIDESAQFTTSLCYAASVIVASLFFRIYSQPSRVAM
jgi:hypothetical protein